MSNSVAAIFPKIEWKVTCKKDFQRTDVTVYWHKFNYRNLVIFRVENISYVIVSCSFNFVRSRYHIMKHV